MLLPALEALSAEALGRFDPTLIDIQAAVVLVAFGWAAWATPPPRRASRRGRGARARARGLGTARGERGRELRRHGRGVVHGPRRARPLPLADPWRGGLPAAGGALPDDAALTKSEGLLFALAGVADGARPRAELRPLRPHGEACSVPRCSCFPPCGRWSTGSTAPVRGTWTRAPSSTRMRSRRTRIPTAADALLGELVSGWSLAAAAVGVALAAACLARAWAAAAFLALWVGLSFGALVLVYLVSTSPIDWHSARRPTGSSSPSHSVLPPSRRRSPRSPGERGTRSGPRIVVVTDPLFDLSGRVAVVTGGMGQLGGALSAALAARGMRVAILDLRNRAARGPPGSPGLDDGDDPRARVRRDRQGSGRGGARSRRGGLGRPAPARQRGGDRRAAGRAGRRGRAVRGGAARRRSSASCTSTSWVSSSRAR